MRRATYFVLALVASVASIALLRVLPADAVAYGPNLLPNASVESGSGGNPTSWVKEGWTWGGTTFTHTWPSGGAQNGSRSLRVSIANHAAGGGDAYWVNTPIAIEPNTTYRVTDYYKSNTNHLVTAGIIRTDGNLDYIELGTFAPSSTWKQFSGQFTTPANAREFVFYHWINSTGYLQTDTFALQKVIPDAPTVSLTAPAAGATVSGNVTVSANATNAVGVQFKVDGVNIGAEDTTAPYSVTWNSTGVGNGSRTLTAVARNSGGSVTSSPRQVTVNNVSVPAPTASITAPAAGATVSGNVTVSANATNAAGVQFKVDGVNIGAEDTTAPYSVTWTTTAVANGGHSLTAVARNSAGQTATSTAVAVTVNNTPPDNNAGAELARPVKIMPLGDSITVGMHGTGSDWWANKSLRGGYRAKLEEQLISAGVQFDMVGGSDAIDIREEEVPDKEHEGHGGWCIVGGNGACNGWADSAPQANGNGGLYAHLGEWLTPYQPDVILLNIGTNDFGGGDSVATVLANYSALIDRIYQLRPNVYLFVSGLNMQNRTDISGSFNTQLQQMVQQKSAANGNRAFYVNTYQGMANPIWGDDANQLHPSLANYEVMGQNWANAMRAGLPGLFRPPATSLPSTPKILALGDSITHGLDQAEGTWSYRFKLQTKLRAANCRYDMVGPYNTLANGQQIAGYDNDHAARAGDASWHSRWDLPGWMTTYRPDAAFIFIGHNDLYGDSRPASQVVAEVKENVRYTIRQLRAGNPQIDIFLAEITPSTLVPDSSMQTLNAAYRALAAETTTTVSPVRTVDMYTGYNMATEHHDGVHPNQAGDEKISQRWFNAIAPVMQSSGSCS